MATLCRRVSTREFRQQQQTKMTSSVGFGTMVLRTFFLGTAVHANSSSSSSSGAAGATSPIRNFEPSWAASAAQGTTIVVSYSAIPEHAAGATAPAREVVVAKDISNNTQTSDRKTAMVIVLRSPYEILATMPAKDLERQKLEIHGVRVRRQTLDQQTNVAGSSRWMLVSDGGLCAMTGLAADVDFLSRSLQKQMDWQRVVYEGSFVGTARQLVRHLSEMLQRATESYGGRPFGVQALVVGQSSTEHMLQLYTVDPSGGFRHWGTGTAIGRGASLVRKQLYGILSEHGTPHPANAADALQVALKASFLTMKETNTNVDNDSYQALLVWTDDRDRVCVGAIDDDDVRKCIERVRESLAPHVSPIA
jgi:20S proteasome alpha/beta subunit